MKLLKKFTITCHSMQFRSANYRFWAWWNQLRLKRKYKPWRRNKGKGHRKASLMDFFFSQMNSSSEATISQSYGLYQILLLSFLALDFDFMPTFLREKNLADPWEKNSHYPVGAQAERGRFCSQAFCSLVLMEPHRHPTVEEHSHRPAFS